MCGPRGLYVWIPTGPIAAPRAIYLWARRASLRLLLVSETLSWLYDPDLVRLSPLLCVPLLLHQKGFLSHFHLAISGLWSDSWHDWDFGLSDSFRAMDQTFSIHEDVTTTPLLPLKRCVWVQKFQRCCWPWCCPHAIIPASEQRGCRDP